MKLLTARYVAPVVGPPLEDGAVLIRAGRVVAVDRRSALSAEAVIDYGDAVICPGFVNAHTHLELSHLAGQVPPGSDLADWLGRLVNALAQAQSEPQASACAASPGPSAPRGPKPAAQEEATSDQRRDRDHSSRDHQAGNDPSRDREGAGRSSGGFTTRPESAGVAESVLDGIRRSIASGVTLVGDITREPAVVRPLLASSNLRSVSFGEVIAIGTRRGLLAERLNAAASTEHACERMHIGVSPHAPYTLEPDGLTACANRAQDAGLPICIHLAETRDEEAFTMNAEGPLAEHLKRLGVWDAEITAAGVRPVGLVDRCGLLTSRTVAAHANYVTDAEIALLARRGTSVAYCPRTHAAFGHEPHPYRAMIEAGVNVCIGTDSLASNPSLSVLDDLRFLWRRGDGLDAETLLRLGTLNGAIALGWSDSAGAIAPGMPADLAVVPIEPGPKRRGIAAIFETDAPPRAVYIGRVFQNAIG